MKIIDLKDIENILSEVFNLKKKNQKKLKNLNRVILKNGTLSVILIY